MLLRWAIAIVCLSWSLSCSLYSYAAEQTNTVHSDDGREVVLDADGSWYFKSGDRFATAADGRRVRLKADGNWEYSGEVVQARSRVSDAFFIGQQQLHLAIETFVVQTKRSESHKNSRKKTRMLFSLQITRGEEAGTGTVGLPLSLIHISEPTRPY